jgi:hypothetical protein
MYASVENLVEIEIKGTPLVDLLSDEQIDQIQGESAQLLAGYMRADGALAMPIRAHFVAGRRL